MVKIINATPHDITVITEKGTTVYPRSGIIARVETTQTLAVEINGIPLFQQEFGKVEGLPEPEFRVMYIVSGMVLQASKGVRDDLIAPNTAKAVRNDKGEIIGVPSFVV